MAHQNTQCGEDPNQIEMIVPTLAHRLQWCRDAGAGDGVESYGRWIHSGVRRPWVEQQEPGLGLAKEEE